MRAIHPGLTHLSENQYPPLNPPRLQFQQPDGRHNLEPPLARRARVEESQPAQLLRLPRFIKGHVAVSKHNGIGGMLQIGRQSRVVPVFRDLHDMGQIDAATAQFKGLDLGEFGLRPLAVVVAAHRR